MSPNTPPGLSREFPQEYRGLRILRDHPDPSVNVVAVHGLGAHPIGTWTDKTQGKEEWIWLEHQLITVIPRARVWTFGYNSTWCGNGSVFLTLRDVADKLLDALDSKDLRSGGSKPLIFVAHSFGGIVILKAFIKNEIAKDPEFNLFKSTRAILFFGTPFWGIHKWFQDTLPQIAQKHDQHVEKNLFETFKRKNDQLRDLREDFCNIAKRYQKLNICCFWEGQLSNIGKIVDDDKIKWVTLVDHESAVLTIDSSGGVPQFKSRLLERNHFNLHKFAKDDPVFDTVEHMLRKIVPREMQDSIARLLKDDTFVRSDTVCRTTNQGQETEIHMKAMRGEVEAIGRLLREHKADVSCVDVYGRTPLHWAVICKRPAVIRVLLTLGADQHATDMGNKKPLDYLEDDPEIWWVFTHGPELEVSNSASETALLFFTKRANLSVMRSLLTQGADVEAKNSDGYTPLAVACVWADEHVFHLLYEHLADLESKCARGRTPLYLASRAGNELIVLYLLRYRAKVNEIDAFGETALMAASRSGRVDITKMLLDKKANVGARDRRGSTALMYAVISGQSSVVDFLARKGGADVNQVDDQGMTALMMASASGRKDIARILLSNGANTQVNDKDHYTALMYAARFGRLGVVQLFVNEGYANVSEYSNWGPTALYQALRGNHVSMTWEVVITRAQIKVYTLVEYTSTQRAERKAIPDALARHIQYFANERAKLAYQIVRNTGELDDLTATYEDAFES